MAPKYISDADKDLLLKLSHADLSVSNITRLFGWTAKKVDGKMVRTPPKFDTTHHVILKAGEYINLKELDTTVGSILFNKLFVEGKIEAAIPNHFFDGEVTGKTFKKFVGYIEKALMEETIKVEPDLLEFLYAYEFYSMKLVTIFSPSYTQRMFQLDKSVVKERERLLKERKSDDVTELVSIEDQLVAYAKDQLKGDPGMTLYDSGARGKFEEGYKTMSLMVGPIKNESTGKFDFIPRGYLDGLKKEDLVAAGNISINSAYPKSVGTEVGGYLTKQFYAVYQSIITDPTIEDCGSKNCLEFVLKKDMVDKFLYQYIKVGDDSYELLTEDNAPKFVGKIVKIRSPMFCASPAICHKCMGDLPRRLGIKNIGLTTGRVPNTLLAKKMKLMHVGKIQFDEVDVDSLLL